MNFDHLSKVCFSLHWGKVHLFTSDICHRTDIHASEGPESNQIVHSDVEMAVMQTDNNV